MEWLDRRVSELEVGFLPGDSGCELQQHNNELENVDVDRAGEKLLASAIGPHDIEPIVEVVAVGPSSNSTCVSEACELRVSWNNVTDAYRPWSGFIGEEMKHGCQLKCDGVGNRDNCLCFPNHDSNIT